MSTPPHYRCDGRITCKDAMDSMMCNFHHRGVIGYWWGCAFKYLWRWPYKGVREDLEKAKACIDYLLEYLPGGEDS
jgi:hypothetical protein